MSIFGLCWHLTNHLTLNYIWTWRIILKLLLNPGLSILKLLWYLVNWLTMYKIRIRRIIRKWLLHSWLCILGISLLLKNIYLLVHVRIWKTWIIRIINLKLTLVRWMYSSIQMIISLVSWYCVNSLHVNYISIFVIYNILS